VGVSPEGEGKAYRQVLKPQRTRLSGQKQKLDLAGSAHKWPCEVVKTKQFPEPRLEQMEDSVEVAARLRSGLTGALVGFLGAVGSDGQRRDGTSQN
jgi:hypothetical protein